ncbi:OB-fold domain-containing protein [Pseudonocardia sp. RS11V-5]|uniref:OB-fold domain-containing protein n=1 Tax=Pseudonocardia terrae TaxID=2905831 RepID=UPI001E42FC73|nr:OB-fold domain-containing protein [Pseudonocardia terrae]MCE3551437.1 OB-fold domain-containing protein [Pseudonocardia terrae]
MATELGVGRPTKRRPGAAVGGLPVADSRPSLVDGQVGGVRCTTCRYPVAQTGIPWCPACYGPVEPARFAATGAAWSSTVVQIPVGTRRPPFGLAYLDLDDGPRVLVHLAEPTVLPLGARLRITGLDDGDLTAVTIEKGVEK